MKKIICDFCGEETENSKEYILPSICRNALLKVGYEIGEEKKDVCFECQKKIASLLELVPKMKFEDNGKSSMSISW